MVKLPFIQDLQARGLAETFLDTHGWKRKNGFPVIDVETVSNISNVPVLIMSGLASNCGSYGSGFNNTKNNRYEIIIDADHYSFEYRSAQFTIAEEIGHFIAHKQFLNDIKTVEDRVAFEDSLTEEEYRYFEMQAKKIGSALLLPQKIFDPFILNWCRINIAKVNGWVSYDKDDLSKELANEFKIKFDISTPVINRAFSRKSPTRLIDEIVAQLNIQLQINVAPNKITEKK